ncbi:MAG TPA: phosphoribosylglycinamide formyltransferase [Thermoplasmata archaeon]|nr:phosphoribosylglycinamide formyltransferase [Thermoplasmata archaeon]
MDRPLAVAFLVSGEGTTLDALAAQVADGTLPVRIVLVVADREGAPALARAQRRGLPTRVLPRRTDAPEAWAAELTHELEAAGAELIVNAGFLSILPDGWVRRWAGRAINVHPSLLPRHGGRGMYGDRVYRAVLAAGDAETGATVHLVTSDVDRGPAVDRARLPVVPGDTPASLRARLHPVEVELLARTIRRFATGALPLPYRPRPAATPADDERRP